MIKTPPPLSWDAEAFCLVANLSYFHKSIPNITFVRLLTIHNRPEQSRAAPEYLSTYPSIRQPTPCVVAVSEMDENPFYVGLKRDTILQFGLVYL